MDGKVTTGIGVAAALVAGPSVASPTPNEPAVPPAASYAELLQPIPNAVERLAQSNAEAAARPAALIPVQYQDHHHHHHHSSDWYRQNGYVWSGGAWVLRPRSHHHHHHHSNDWYRQNGYIWSGGAWVLRPTSHHHHHHNNY
jgi:hypothetical protein